MAANDAVVVTGVSTGIGRATAGKLVQHGFQVFGTVRRPEDAARLTAELGGGFVPLLTDVTDEAAIRQAAVQVRTALGGRRLAGLVNNAGIAVSGPLTLLPVEEFRQQLRVNVEGPFLMVQAFAPLLGADPGLQGRPGRIVQISSIGGKMSFPFIGAYHASKFALEGMSESLRRELMLYGIDVIVIGPGGVKTPMISKAEADDMAQYQGSDFWPSIKRFKEFFLEDVKRGMEPEELAETIFTVLTTDRPKVRYAPVAGKFKNWIMPRLLPKRMVDKAVSKQFGIHP